MIKPYYRPFATTKYLEQRLDIHQLRKKYSARMLINDVPMSRHERRQREQEINIANNRNLDLELALKERYTGEIVLPVYPSETGEHLVTLHPETINLLSKIDLNPRSMQSQANRMLRELMSGPVDEVTFIERFHIDNPYECCKHLNQNGYQVKRTSRVVMDDKGKEVKQKFYTLTGWQEFEKKHFIKRSI